MNFDSIFEEPVQEFTNMFTFRYLIVGKRWLLLDGHSNSNRIQVPNDVDFKSGSSSFYESSGFRWQFIGADCTFTGFLGASSRVVM